MAENNTLEAVREILLEARIAHITGTAAQWATANPVLLKGEIGIISDTSPAQFKIGDGVKKWSELGWANTTALSQLAGDATHRLVTDAEKTAWNKKGEVFNFDYGKYTSGDPAMVEAQKNIVARIIQAAVAGSDITIFAHNVGITGIGNGDTSVSGPVNITGISSSRVEGEVSGYAFETENAEEAVIMVSSRIAFKSDRTVVLESFRCSPSLVTEYGLPSYNLEKVDTESGYASTYHLKKNGRKIGASINIPLDQVLRGSSIKSVTTAGAPYTGAKVGDKYIEFLFQNNSTPQYLPVQDLVDVYTGDGTYIEVTASNVIQLKYAALKSRLQTDFGSVFDVKGAGAAAAKAAVDEFKASTFVIQCSIPGMN